MKKLLLALLLSSFALPAAAIDAVNPETLCERFLKDADRQSCRQQAKKLDLDWYAASVCALVDSDSEFMSCWQDVNGRHYSPPDLVECVTEDMADSERRDCLKRISLKNAKRDRLPASSPAAKKPVKKEYQDMKIRR
ncbi:MAG: hypothetical protein KF802_03175 [Bdellovibrionaceae bacterium]|nr:hypothetical protein [Pseudobdellovibrionaceae bacterium]MBX3033378.1 hypothetical protein [Pseudobdellovibrionaceae bacterium]